MKTATPFKLSHAATVLALSMLSIAGCTETMGQQRIEPRLPQVAVPQSSPVGVMTTPYPPVGNVIPVFVKPFADHRGQRLYDPNRITALDSNGTKIAPMSEQEAASVAGGADRLYDSVTHPGTAVVVLRSALFGAYMSYGTFGVIGPSELLRAGTLALSADGRLRSVMLNEQVISWSPGPIEEVAIAAKRLQNGGSRMLPVLPRNATQSGCNCFGEPPVGGYLFFPLREYVALEVPIADVSDNRTEIVRVRWGEFDSSVAPNPIVSPQEETE